MNEKLEKKLKEISLILALKKLILIYQTNTDMPPGSLNSYHILMLSCLEPSVSKRNSFKQILNELILISQDLPPVQLLKQTSKQRTKSQGYVFVCFCSCLFVFNFIYVCLIYLFMFVSV